MGQQDRKGPRVRQDRRELLDRKEPRDRKDRRDPKVIREFKGCKARKDPKATRVCREPRVRRVHRELLRQVRTWAMTIRLWEKAPSPA